MRLPKKPFVKFMLALSFLATGVMPTLVLAMGTLPPTQSYNCGGSNNQDVNSQGENDNSQN